MFQLSIILVHICHFQTDVSTWMIFLIADLNNKRIPQTATVLDIVLGQCVPRAASYFLKILTKYRPKGKSDVGHIHLSPYLRH